MSNLTSSKLTPKVGIATIATYVVTLASVLSMGESRTQQEADSGGLVAASTGFPGSWCVNIVHFCQTL